MKLIGSGELGPLLWQLVRGDLSSRYQAAQTLVPLKFEWMETAQTPENPLGEWPAQVRAALTAPGFRTRDWITALMETMETGQQLRMEAHHQERRIEKAEAAALETQIRRETGKRQLKKLAKQRRELSRFDAPKTGRRAELELTCNQWLNVQVEANILYNCLGDLVLETPDKLRQWLSGDGKYQRYAARALADVGPKANAFAPDLLAKLDRDELKFDFWGVLATIAQGDAKMIEGLLFRVENAPLSIASTSLHVLRSIGPRVARVCPDAIPILLRALDNATTRIAAVYALGAVANGNAKHETTIVTRLLELSRTDDLWLKGATIWALGDLNARADLVVPRLIEAFDDYDEPDPDYCYHSAHSFVTMALEKFGPCAAPAVPALLRHIHYEGEGLDRGVLDALTAIGAAAEPWLREIETVAEQWRDDELDAEDNPLDVIVNAIRAERQ